MKHFLSPLAALAIAGAGPGMAAEPATPPAEPTSKPAKEIKAKDKLICATQKVAGSVIPKRVCQTQKQIDAQLQAVEDLNRERREAGGTRSETLGMTPSGTLSGR